MFKPRKYLFPDKNSASESPEGRDPNPPGVAGANIVGSGEAALVDGHGYAVQAVHIGQGLAHVHIRKTLGKENDIAVNGAVSFSMVMLTRSP